MFHIRVAALLDCTMPVATLVRRGSRFPGILHTLHLTNRPPAQPWRYYAESSVTLGTWCKKTPCKFLLSLMLPVANLEDQVDWGSLQAA